MKYTVYKHTTPDGAVYVGTTSQKPHLRWNFGKGYKKNKEFFGIITQVGWDNIKHEILEENLTKEQAYKKEIELIDHYRKNGLCLNIHKGGNTSRKGLPHSDETKEILREQKPKKKVLCLETDTVYESIHDAGKKTKTRYQDIWRVCKGQRKTCGGYHWKYAEEITT